MKNKKKKPNSIPDEPVVSEVSDVSGAVLEESAREKENSEASACEDADSEETVKQKKHPLRTLFSKPPLCYRLVQIYLFSFLTTYVVEAFSHYKSLPQLLHVIRHPLVFLANMLIVSILFIPAILFRKRVFAFIMAAVVWLTVGVVDFIVLHNRVTPFNANDFKMIDDALNVVVHYFTVPQIIMVVVAIIFGIFVIFFSAIKSPKTAKPVPFKTSIPLCAALIGLHIMLISGSVRVGILERTFPNLANAYQDYGLPYCFTFSIVDKGIKKPSDYSKGRVNQVIDKLPSSTPTPSKEPDKVDDSLPNVIVIQLESFFDPKRIDGIRFETDPIPNFTRLFNHYSSGYLTVPSISAGTANTEFEVLTGMNMADFGTGEYPYRTILQTTTTESLAYNLKNHGYACHAIHNNTASFYGRDVVFSNLGFDDFDSIETMTGVERNALNWAKDKVLYPEIVTALDSTPGPDFVFAVSVQGHGKYPDEEILENTVTLNRLTAAFDDSTIYGLRYYTSQLNEMDAFVGSLLSYLAERKEKTVLVLYGDHLPGFDFEEDSLKFGSLLQTEYVIWSNYPMETVHKDLYAYQLAAYVQERIGLHEGYLTRLHQAHLHDEAPVSDTYLSELQVLSYDMLYGEQYCWDGVNPYKPTELRFGFHKPTITDTHTVYASDDTCYLTVYGTRFSPYASVYINGTRYKETIYVTESELFLPGITLEDGDILSVGIYNDGELLSESEDYPFHRPVIN